MTDLTLAAAIKPLIDAVHASIDRNGKNGAGIDDLRKAIGNLTDGIKNAFTDGNRELTVASVVDLFEDQNLQVVDALGSE